MNSKEKKKKLTLKNLNHYRDFISMEDISKIIFILMRKKFSGILNLGSGKGIFLKDIAKIIAAVKAAIAIPRLVKRVFLKLLEIFLNKKF